MILKLNLDLPEDSMYISLARIIGRDILQELHVVAEDIGDVETLVTELASNVVRHAHSVKGRFQVVLEYYADRIDITVIDTGGGFSFCDIPDIGTVRPDEEGHGEVERIGGFGMLLLEGMSDKLTFRRTDPNGTTVCAEKRLRYETKQADENAKDMNYEGAKVTITKS